MDPYCGVRKPAPPPLPRDKHAATYRMYRVSDVYRTSGQFISRFERGPLIQWNPI